MPTTRQRMSHTEIEHIVAQRVTNAIEVIAIYEKKIHIAHDSRDQVVRQGAKVARVLTTKRSGKEDSRSCNNLEAPVANQKHVVTYFRCGAQGNLKSKCPRLKNQNRGNQKGKKGKARKDSDIVNR
ncbi:hypothetical protein Tco_0948075 [Tanacetum coccineum]